MTVGDAESPSMIRTWAALAAVSLGIFIITMDGSMMRVAIGSIVVLGARHPGRLCAGGHGVAFIDHGIYVLGGL